MALDELDGLLREITQAVDELEETVKGEKTPSIREKAPAMTAAAQGAPEKAAEPEAVSLPDRRDVQVHGLRCKYFGQMPNLELQAATLPVLKQWHQKKMTEMSDGELYLYARQQMVAGGKNNQANQAVLLLNSRKEAEKTLRNFLPGYLFVQKPSSLQGLENLCTHIPQMVPGGDTIAYSLYAVYCMARYSANVTRYFQEKQEQGFRDRQAVLDAAQKNARQMLDDANENLRRL